MKRVKEERLAESGWDSQRALLKEPVFQEVRDAILSSGLMVVELGAGPGGGHMPMVLERNPLAAMLVNDFECRMLAEWKTFLVSRGLGQGLSFACFDACNIPIASASVDCVYMLADPAMGGIWMMMPGLIAGWAALAESVGFTVQKDTVLVRRAVTKEDGEFGRLAAQSGIAVEAEFHYILARKRGLLGH